MKNQLNSLIVFVVLFISSCAEINNQSTTSADNHSSTSVRNVSSVTTEQIVNELKKHFESDLSAERRDEIKIVQENLLKYLIEASNREDTYKIKIYKDATNYLNKMDLVLLNNIKNEQLGNKDFGVVSRAPIWTLKDELAYLNKDVEKLPMPKNQIDLIAGLKMISPYYQNYQKLGPGLKTLVADNYDKTAAKILGKNFSLYPSLSEIEKIVAVDGSDDDKIVKVMEIVEERLKVLESSIRNIGTFISQSGQVDMKNPQMVLVVKFMDYYFNKLPDDVIKTILSELVTAGPKMTEESVLSIVFQNTGPGLGKVLQQLGREKGIGENFSALMGLLESSGKQVPIHLVQDVVDHDAGGFVFKSITAKPLGTGTVAQVNKAILINEDVEKTVALRLLKPGVANRCKEDMAILRRFVPDNQEILEKQGIKDIKMVGTLVDSVDKFLSDELDFEMSVARQKKAFEVYTRAIKIEKNSKFNMLNMVIPDVYLPPNGKSNLHIQEFLTGGVKFSKLEDVGAQKVVSEEMLRMWFEESLFKSGYLHADLHQGNFNVVLLEDEKKIKVLIYDFGMSTTLNKEDQRAFILIGAGAELKSSSIMTDGLMASMNSTDAEFKKKIMQAIAMEMKDFSNKSPEEWVLWCVKKNYFVSEKLGAFARGMSLVKQLPESLGESEMLKSVIHETAMKNLAQAVVDRSYDFPLTKIDLIKIGAVEIKNSCMDLLRSFF